MDFLITILQACDAAPYIGNFKRNGILDVFALKSLTLEDLEILIEDETVRKKVNLFIENFQLPAGRKINRVINEQYISLVLHLAAEQLQRHLAIITTASTRTDMAILCDTEVGPYLTCLQNRIISFKRTLKDFKAEIQPEKSRSGKSKHKKIIIINSIIATSIVILCTIKYWTRR